ncbi:NACHT domain-containing protein, partial [Streptomyces sp. NPDC002920]
MSPLRHPGRAHLVAVITKDGAVRGSGYLLAPDVVLTAGHVVASVPPGELQVCRLTGLRYAPAEVVWTGHDVALLTTGKLAEEGELTPVVLSELAADAEFDDCAALGLPTVMTRPTAGVTPLEARFRVASNSADTHGYLSLELQGHPPTGDHPWGGMSGTPVFHAGRWLVGVIVRDSAGWGHSRLEAVPVSAFRDASPLLSAVCRTGPPLTARDARDSAFLDTYRQEVIRRFGHIQLFGLGQRGLEDDMQIEHAYVSLHAGLPPTRLTQDDQARPVEQLLPKNPRLLLRGDPGAGKSTLLEWVAVSMARRSCKGPLEPFNDQVPFLIRLRDMYAPRWKQAEGSDGVLPQPEQFLRFSRMGTGAAPPDGWIHRMLDGGRALLLVDGLDEVLEIHRDGVLRWIGALLRDFRSLHVIVTGRPEAIEHWQPPRKLGFAELRLRELNKDQRSELIRKWHREAVLGVRSARYGEEESERRIARLTSLETSLIERVDASDDLAALAASPLLCAVLCKLHEVHATRLPRFRHELYKKTIDMMLGLRDEDREVPDPLPHLDVDQRRAILSWVAGYLTTEGEREITPERFDQKVDERLLSLGREAGARTAGEIRKALQERSGLLVALSEDTLRFSHRTFQDYLAATDMVARRAFGQLAGRAGDETWNDVLHFAMSQCTVADTGEFVTQFRRKVRLETNRRRRERMRLAAASCIPYAVQMSEADREVLVTGVARSFLTLPETAGLLFRSLEEYVGVGPDLLTAIERKIDWKIQASRGNTLALAKRIRGPEALRLLRQIPAEVRRSEARELVGFWNLFPGPEYAADILAGLDLPFLQIQSPDELS